MSERTPGAWMEGEQHESKVDIVAVVNGKFSASIARVCIPLPRTLDHKEMQANARLIAAAPDLLAALQELLKFPSGQYSESDGWDAAEEMAISAIAKVTGSP